jgi:hypothetical protein
MPSPSTSATHPPHLVSGLSVTARLMDKFATVPVLKQPNCGSTTEAIAVLHV